MTADADAVVPDGYEDLPQADPAPPRTAPPPVETDVPPAPARIPPRSRNDRIGPRMFEFDAVRDLADRFDTA